MKPDPDNATAQGPKIGSGHASAMFRQGLRELRAALYTDSNLAQPTEYGMAGTLTPGEVADSRRNFDQSFDQEPTNESILESRIRQTEQDAPKKESLDLSLDR